MLTSCQRGGVASNGAEDGSGNAGSGEGCTGGSEDLEHLGPGVRAGVGDLERLDGPATGGSDGGVTNVCFSPAAALPTSKLFIEIELINNHMITHLNPELLQRFAASLGFLLREIGLEWQREPINWDPFF